MSKFPQLTFENPFKRKVHKVYIRNISYRKGIGMRKILKNFVIVSILVFAFVGVGFGEEKQGGQIDKKYPPYPDVWDVPVLTKEEYKKGIWTSRKARLPNGDYVVIKWRKGRIAGCTTLFGREELPIEECKKIDESWGRCRVTKNPNDCIYAPKHLTSDRVSAEYDPGHTTSLKYDDGTIIEWETLWLGNCAPIFNYRLVVYKYENGKKVVLKKLVPVKLLDKPRKEVVNTKCARNWDYKGKYMITRVQPAGPGMYILDDGTMFNLFWIGDEEYAIRFDKNINSKSKFFNTKIFFIDEDEFNRYVYGRNRDIDDQQVVNRVYNYIKSKYLKNSKGGKP